MKAAYYSDGTQDNGGNLARYLRTSHNINAKPRLIADWNLNLFTNPYASNTPAEDLVGFDPDIFPIDSIIEGYRPNKGIVKGLVNQATLSSGYSDPNSGHYYIGSEDDIYKYWLSPYPSDGNATMPLYTDGITTCRPQVAWPAPIAPNKIVIKFENTWASPGSYRIRTQSSVGGTWTTVATNVAPDAKGNVTLYYNGSSWSSSRPSTLIQTVIAGIRLEVDTLAPGRDQNNNVTTFYSKAYNQVLSTTGGYANLALISIEPRLEYDLTPYLTSIEDNFDMAEDSKIYPVGTTISNGATVNLFNSDNVFNIDNPSSPFYTILGKNVEMRLDYVYNANGIEYYVNQFKLYTSDTWSGQFGDTVSVPLTDYSMVMKETKPLAMMVENKPVSEIIWRLCDSIGFSDYIVTNLYESDFVIPVWWTDGTQTIWEIFDDLSTSTQTAIYFDNLCRLRIKTTKNAFADINPVWTASGISSTDKLSDIIDSEAGDDYGPNRVLVKYKTTNWRTGSTGEPALSRVWEPEGDSTVVRSSPIQKSIDNNSGWIYIRQTDAASWPYSSKVNIDGEILEYDAKEFRCVTYTEIISNTGIKSYVNPVVKYIPITTHQQYLDNHNKTPVEYQSQNYFTGAFRIKERELWNTAKQNHNVDITGWVPLALINNNLRTIGGLAHNITESVVTLAPSSAQMKTVNDVFTLYRGGYNDTPFNKYGTRIRLRGDSARSTRRAGMMIGNNYSLDGYYIELRTTDSIGTSEAKTSSEIVVYSKKGTALHTLLKSPRTAVYTDRWYDLEAKFQILSNGQHRITVWLNGVVVATATTVAASKQNAATGLYGMYVRGQSIADYEYMYGLTRGIDEPEDDFGFYDLLYGGLRSGYWQREFVFEWASKVVRTKKNKKQTIKFRKNNYFFDEFGPYMHEVREFNVKFDPAPVQIANIFSTNEWYAQVIDFVATPFGAKFYVCNVGRKNAVIQGEDTLLVGTTFATVNQVCNILGRDLVISEDDEVITVENARAIRQQGLTESELSGQWIQNKSAATGIGKWIAEHWSAGRDSVTINLFGNPLLEIGDVVSVNYPDKFMYPNSHKYFVVGCQNSWDNGLTTSLRLRRAITTPSADVTVR